MEQVLLFITDGLPGIAAAFPQGNTEQPFRGFIPWPAGRGAWESSSSEAKGPWAAGRRFEAGVRGAKPEGSFAGFGCFPEGTGEGAKESLGGSVSEGGGDGVG